MGNGGIAPRILNLGVTWTWVFSFMPRRPYPQETACRYPVGRRLGGPQGRYGRGGGEKKFRPPAGKQTPVIQPIALVQYTPFTVGKHYKKELNY